MSNIDRRWPGRNALWEIPALTLLAVGVAILLGGGARELTVAGCIGCSPASSRQLQIASRSSARLFEAIAAFAATLIVWAFRQDLRPDKHLHLNRRGRRRPLAGLLVDARAARTRQQRTRCYMARLGRVLSVLLELGCGAFLGFAVIGPSLLRTGDVMPHAVSRLPLVDSRRGADDGRHLDRSRHAAARCRLGLRFELRGLAHVASASRYAPLQPISAFLSAFFCGVIANVGARVLRVPQALMLVPALLVLVPGSLTTKACSSPSSTTSSSAVTFGINATFAAVQLVAGLYSRSSSYRQKPR